MDCILAPVSATSQPSGPADETAHRTTEVISLVEDLPRSAEAGLDLDIEYHTGDPGLDARSSELRTKRKEMERHAAEVARETRELAGQLAGQLPVSDTAILLGVSKGRITQLQVPHPRTTDEDSRDTQRQRASN